ncbi:presequence protease, mitochondrial-like isoform X1 [Macrosteles quadrilineatus]|uniref:presequence protease, mitochondrial-like isoform X1 n=2 Tax=Macrosteles quadrilineatus TaxID=74068 RepID=UPI0023E2FD2B|nr:presequence protease, mitochondrial-like isoform X1 [Macrosteles quadrilineatus]
MGFRRRRKGLDMNVHIPNKMWRSGFLFSKQWNSLKPLNHFYGRRNVSSSAFAYQTLNLETRQNEHDFKENQSIEGFTVQQISPIPEFQMRAIHLLHDDTGAQYLHLDRNDSNNAFSINLRTTPFDSTGVPHILEHTTLCGSKKYPCRDPFFKMLNRSLATFMNAMTGPDYTLYPFSTQNHKDFYNLMSVYMDAVFNPQLKESDFRQEGWRLEHEIVNDSSSPIIFKGVVFNEMKGALSENSKLFYEHLMNKILPSHTYSVISGGDPLHIPQLTYKQLKDFHARYYHPSNARFYSYGNFSLINHLKFVNEAYLKNYGKVETSYSEFTKVPQEKRWSSEKRESVFGKVDNMASNPEKQSSLALSYLCSDIKDINESFTIQVLSELLTSGPNSPFYQSLVEPNVGSGFSPVTGFEGQTRDTFFSVGLQGLSTKDFDWVVETSEKTIDKVIKEGFDQRRIEAILHEIELTTKHQSTDFGLRFLYGLTSLWNHDGDIIKSLKVNDIVDTFKSNLSNNPHYLQEKVEEYLKQNHHKLILTMSPDEQYDEKKIKLENDLLQNKLASLTSEMKKTIFEDGLRLQKEQEEKQNVDCLPTLKSDDLKKHVEKDEVQQTVVSDIPVHISLQPTNSLTYVRGILDTSHIENDLKPFIPLFSKVATKMGTKSHNYKEFDQLVHLKTGGLSLSHHIVEKKDDPNSFEDGIMFSSYALDTNVESMFSIWNEMFNEVKFDDKGRLETLMKSNAVNMVNRLAEQGHLYAMSASAALVNPASLRSEEISGLQHVKWFCNLVQQSQYEIILSKLDSIANNLFSKRFMRIAVNASPESEVALNSTLDSFIKSIPGSFEKPIVTVDNNGYIKPNKYGIHYESSLPVSYTSKSIQTVPYLHKDYAPLRILCRLLSSKYLLPTVREKGGAYGAGARLNSAGVISFFSYRDPNPAKTFNVFDASLDWLNKKEFTGKDIEEAKLGTFQTVDAPVPPGARGTRQFLYGISDEEFARHRLELMAVKEEDVLRVASKYLDPSCTSCEGRVLFGPKNTEVSKRHGEQWKLEQI